MCSCTFHKMKHFLRMGFSNSTIHYQGDLDKPLQGVLQGNRALPAVWAAVSTPIINILRCLQAELWGRSSISHCSLHIVSFSFVNDTTLVQGEIGSKQSQPMEDLQTNSNIWDEAAATIGGFISAKKSFGQLVEYISKSKNRWLVQRNKDHVQFWITQDNKRVLLKILNPEESDQILGNFLQRDWSDMAVKKYLVEKTKQ